MSRLAVSVFVACLATRAVQASTIQILHTNDLHSYFDRSESPTLGGYAPLKATLERLKAEGAARGIESLTLDAGDFGEGNPFYLASGGVDSWSMMGAIGYDAVTLGNHDYLEGQPGLNSILIRANPSFPVLAANFEPWEHLAAIRRHFHRSIELRRAGLRVGIFGLTTSDVTYRWRAGQGSIKNPEDAARRELGDLRHRNDLVIALTHLGLDSDKSLVRGTRGIDVVVGGHSHDLLVEPVFESDDSGRRVPIVQAGAHGQFVGQLTLEMGDGRPTRILSYRVVPVHADGPRDFEVDRLVADARRSLEQRLGPGWLETRVGCIDRSWDNPEAQGGQTPGSRFVIESMRRAAGADIAIDGTQFYGDAIPPGPVTRESILRFYPRVFEFDATPGWTVWTSKARGFGIKFFINLALKAGFAPHLAGLDIDYSWSNGHPRATAYRVNGRPLRTFGRYNLALAEGIARWIRESTVLFRWFVVTDIRDTGRSIWSSVEQNLKTSFPCR